MLRNKVLEDIDTFARKNPEAADYTYGMIFNFKYKDYDQIIEDIDAQVFDNLPIEDKLIVKEIVDCVCDITGHDYYLTIGELESPQTITCIDSGVDSLAHNEHTIDLFESSISDSFDTTYGKLDFQNKVKDDNDKQDIIDAATKIVKDTNEEAKKYSDEELSDEAEKSFEDNKQKSAIENGTTTETKEAQEKIEQYEMQESIFGERISEEVASEMFEDFASDLLHSIIDVCRDKMKKYDMDKDDVIKALERLDTSDPQGYMLSLDD